VKIKIVVEFEVTPVDDDEEFTEDVARSAASIAAYDYLSLVKISGVSTDSEYVEVHVDGFGQCDVRLGEAHE
jgi:hypothetical protein